MEAPRQLQAAADEGNEISISQRNYDGESVVVVDFGQGVEAEVDVVGDTAIVVAGDRQYEFDIPPEATDVSTNDGMLTITAAAGESAEAPESDDSRQ